MQKEDVFYLAIPNSERSRPEVKSLLGKTSPVKKTDEPFVPPPASGIKQEPNVVEETTVSPPKTPDKSFVPVIDPALVPEGEVMING